MKIEELINACNEFSKGDYIIIKRKSIKMSKYGKSRKFIPRVVQYPTFSAQFISVGIEGLSRGYLQTSDGSYYYSKLESVTKAHLKP